MTYSLLIDTAKPTSYVALIENSRLLSKKKWVSDRTMSEKLLSFIDDLLKEHSLSLSQIKRYGVYVGPGHYSALRTGVVVATMLAYTNQADLVEIKSSVFDEQIKEVEKSQPVENIQLVYE